MFGLVIGKVYVQYVLLLKAQRCRLDEGQLLATTMAPMIRICAVRNWKVTNPLLRKMVDALGWIACFSVP